MKNHYKCSHLFTLNTSSRVPFVLLPQICNFAVRRGAIRYKHFIGLICCLGLLLWLFVMYYRVHFLEFLLYIQVCGFCRLPARDDAYSVATTTGALTKPVASHPASRRAYVHGTNAFTAKAKRRAKHCTNTTIQRANRLTDLSRGCANIYIHRTTTCALHTKTYTHQEFAQKRIASRASCAHWTCNNVRIVHKPKEVRFRTFACFLALLFVREGSFAISFRRACASSKTKYHGQ